MGSEVGFVLFGERCSGTNIIEAAVMLNSRSCASQVAGFKHFPKPPSAEVKARLKDLPVIIVVRHPIEWVRAMFAQPWHAATPLLSANFSEFIRMEWWSIWDERASVDPKDPRYGTEMMLDRDPCSGQRYKNLLRMRAGKIRLCLDLASAAKSAAVIRLEDYVENPTRVISQLCEAVGSSKEHTVQIPDGYKGQLSWKRRVASVLGLRSLADKIRPPQRMRPKPTVTAVDEEFIWEELDSQLEADIGYTRSLKL